MLPYTRMLEIQILFFPLISQFSQLRAEQSPLFWPDCYDTWITKALGHSLLASISNPYDLSFSTWVFLSFQPPLPCALNTLVQPSCSSEADRRENGTQPGPSFYSSSLTLLSLKTHILRPIIPQQFLNHSSLQQSVL